MMGASWHGTGDEAPAPPARTSRAPARPAHAGRPDASVLTGGVLPDLLREQARVQPDRIAVSHGGRSLTYRELVGRADRLAGRLRRLGVAADDCVGLYAEPSFDLMTGVWGILFAGAAYLPIAPDYPEERIRYMIEDSRTSIIVTRAAARERLAELAPPGTRVVTVDESLDSATEPGAGPDPRDLAYVIYTSGSSGRPKGAMIEHGSIASQLRWLHEVHGLGPDRVVLQKTPMSFDAAQWEILAPACGSRVILAGPGAHGDPERLIGLILGHGVTTLQCVPTLLQALLETEELHRCTSLTEIFCGGEALSRSLAARCLETLPDCRLVNLYGPTECTINTSSCTVDPATVAEGPPVVPIGSPAYDTRYHILDDRRAPVAAGEIGELCISGGQLARGYLHRPGLTAERFVANPFQSDPGHDRLYRTGDLASRTADGTVHFVGRTDSQVKLRGFRVELDEIRLAIENHEWVRTAAVVVRDDPRTGAPTLIAFIELSPKEAALMDQGRGGAHHVSARDRLQVRAQVSNGGCRADRDLAGRPTLDLPGRTAAPEQWRRVFARKTYRFFEGGAVGEADILALLGGRPAAAARPRDPGTLDLSELAAILRHFGQFHSGERLLPKYGYASPGALYGVQLYVEAGGLEGLTPGLYYYHPVHHRLVLMRAAAAPGRLRVHLVGRRRAIEVVYKTNVEEALELEAGHLVGLFEQILPEYGLDIRPSAGGDPVITEESGDLRLGAFEVVPYDTPRPDDRVEVYVQAHPGWIADLPAGQYRYAAGELRRIGDELVLHKHVVAINQRVYERSSLGIALVGPRYLDLGRRMHHLQANDLNLGFMPAGHSSRGGHDLPVARRLDHILRACGQRPGPAYFAVGGRVSDEQVAARGMKEDAVHMKGPAELIRDDLRTFLPPYMMPNEIVMLDRLPLTANGKIDSAALAAWELPPGAPDRTDVSPRTVTEERIGRIWRTALRRDTVSVHDDFFECGGDSLIAVRLVNRINEQFGTALPVQVMVEAPTIEELARRVDGGAAGPSSRLIRLSPGSEWRPSS